MDSVIKLLKSIALIENPNAWGVSYSRGAFWVCDNDGPEGLFCNEALDKCFAEALRIRGGWCLSLVEEDAPSAILGDEREKTA